MCDIAKIGYQYKENRSLYYGNGKKAVAVAVERTKNIIRQSNLNMFEAFRDAIIMTGIVVFFFLANIRQLFIVGLSIPFVYITTIAIMWLFKMEFNIVTLTAIILALGLLIDDAVVIIENIERHYFNLKKVLKVQLYQGQKK